MLVRWKALLVLFLDPISYNIQITVDQLKNHLKNFLSVENKSLNKICHSTTNQNKFWIQRMRSGWSEGAPGLTTLVKADRASWWEILFCQILLLLFFFPLLMWLTHLRALCWITNINIYILCSGGSQNEFVDLFVYIVCHVRPHCVLEKQFLTSAKSKNA